MSFAVPYLVFNGEGQDALTFYADVFQAEISSVQRFKEMDNFDGDGDAVFGERLMHSRLAKNGEEFIYITDAPYDGFTIGNRVTILINFETEDDIKYAYEDGQSGDGVASGVLGFDLCAGDGPVWGVLAA